MLPLPTTKEAAMSDRFFVSTHTCSPLRLTVSLFASM